MRFKSNGHLEVGAENVFAVYIFHYINWSICRTAGFNIHN